MPLTAYPQLETAFTRLYRYQHLAAIAGWDQAAMMPAKGNDARAAAMAELQVLMHHTLTDPALKPLFDAAAGETLDDVQQAKIGRAHV